MSPKAAFVPWIVVLLAALPAASAEKSCCACRGRLLHAAENGMLCAESFVPAARETFELALPLAKQQFAVKAPDGRWLVADARDGRMLRLDAGAAEPGDRETFEIVPVAAGRSALRWRSSGELLVFGSGFAGPPKPQVAACRNRGDLPDSRVAGDPPDCLADDDPWACRYGTGGQAIRPDAEAEGREVRPSARSDAQGARSHEIAPGARAHRRVPRAGEARRSCRHPDPRHAGAGKLAEADRGCCCCRGGRPAGPGASAIPGAGVASASTGYHVTVLLSAVAEVPLGRSGTDVTVGSPTVLDLNVALCAEAVQRPPGGGPPRGRAVREPRAASQRGTDS